MNDGVSPARRGGYGRRLAGAGDERAIAAVQLLASLGFLAVAAVPYTGFLLVGLFSAPMTV